MSVIQGAITSATAVAANQMPDIDKVLYLLKPYQTPVLQWLYFSQGRNKAEKIINSSGKFYWFEDENYPYMTTLDTAFSSVEASSTDNVNFGDKTMFNEGDIVLIESSEQLVYVDSVDGGEVDITTLSGNNIADASANTHVKIIGSLNYEFDGARTAVATQETEMYNYASVFSETVSTSGRYQAGEQYTDGRTHKEQVRKRIEEMKSQVERNFLFSTERGSKLNSTSKYRATYGYGALGFISTNKTSYAGTLSESAFDNYLKSVFAKGSNIKRHYAGASQIQAINKIVKDLYQVTDTDNTSEYGAALNTYITPFGKLKLFWNPVMDGKFSGYGFTLDEENVKLRFMANDNKGSRKFRIEDHVETPGTDGEITKLLMDVGLQLTNESENGILYDSTTT